MAMMTKQELSTLINECCSCVGEGELNFTTTTTYPHTSYWEILWSDDIASGSGYSEVVTYQISHAAKTPRSAELLALKRALNEHGIHPQIQHEYVAAEHSPAYFHSFFSVDVTENLSE